MRHFWRRRGSFDLERELRANRPEPRPEFLRALVLRVRGEGQAAPRGMRPRALRLTLVGAVTAAMLAALASVGGLGYAASAVNQAFRTAAAITVRPHHVRRPAAPHKVTAADQQEPTGTKMVVICTRAHKSMPVALKIVSTYLSHGAKLGKCTATKKRHHNAGGVKAVRSTKARKTPKNTG